MIDWLRRWWLDYLQRRRAKLLRWTGTEARQLHEIAPTSASWYRIQRTYRKHVAELDRTNKAIARLERKP